MKNQHREICISLCRTCPHLNLHTSLSVMDVLLALFPLVLTKPEVTSVFFFLKRHRAAKLPPVLLILHSLCQSWGCRDAPRVPTELCVAAGCCCWLYCHSGDFLSYVNNKKPLGSFFPDNTSTPGCVSPHRRFFPDGESMMLYLQTPVALVIQAFHPETNR